MTEELNLDPCLDETFKRVISEESMFLAEQCIIDSPIVDDEDIVDNYHKRTEDAWNEYIDWN